MVTATKFNAGYTKNGPWPTIVDLNDEGSLLRKLCYPFNHKKRIEHQWSPILDPDDHKNRVVQFILWPGRELTIQEAQKVIQSDYKSNISGYTKFMKPIFCNDDVFKNKNKNCNIYFFSDARKSKPHVPHIQIWALAKGMENQNLISAQKRKRECSWNQMTQGIL